MKIFLAEAVAREKLFFIWPKFPLIHAPEIFLGHFCSVFGVSQRWSTTRFIDKERGNIMDIAFEGDVTLAPLVSLYFESTGYWNKVFLTSILLGSWLNGWLIRKSNAIVNPLIIVIDKVTRNGQNGRVWRLKMLALLIRVKCTHACPKNNEYYNEKYNTKNGCGWSLTSRKERHSRSIIAHYAKTCSSTLGGFVTVKINDRKFYYR